MTIETVLHTHFSRYTAMQIQDVYKLLYQAALGSEHAISNSEDARQSLERELAEMGAGTEEVTIDPISADEQIVRVHLRPFAVQGGDPQTLLDAFTRTANEFRGNRQLLEDYWESATGMQHFPSAEMNSFIETVREQNYPAMHHSPEYEKLYRPAYRVIWRKYISW
jgi:hypothetical protein